MAINVQITQKCLSFLRMPALLCHMRLNKSRVTQLSKGQDMGNNIVPVKENFKGAKLSLLSLTVSRIWSTMPVLEKHEYIEPWGLHTKKQNGLESNEWFQTQVSFTTSVKKQKDKTFWQVSRCEYLDRD